MAPLGKKLSDAQSESCQRDGFVCITEGVRS